MIPHRIDKFQKIKENETFKSLKASHKEFLLDEAEYLRDARLEHDEIEGVRSRGNIRGYLECLINTNEITDDEQEDLYRILILENR